MVEVGGIWLNKWRAVLTIRAIQTDSAKILTGCKVEPSLASAKPCHRCQFERLGYFCIDTDSAPEHLVINRTVTPRDTWAKLQKQQKQKGSSG